MPKSFKTLMLASVVSSGCVAGPGGANNAANRAITGIAVGAVLGGAAGKATGVGAFDGAAAGAIVGGALGAAVNPNQVFKRDTRGYCYVTDESGRPVLGPDGQVIYDYSRRC